MTGGYRKFRSILDQLEEGILAVLLTFMTSVTFIQVVLRYVFNTGWVWSLEATSYAFAWLVLVGMSYGVRTRTHIAVDLVVRKLPQGVKYYIALLAAGLCIVYAGLMLYGSWMLVSGLHMLGNYARDIPLPKWLLTSVMPIAFVLLAFRFLEVGVRVIKGRDGDLMFGTRDIEASVTAKSPDHEEGMP